MVDSQGLIAAPAESPAVWLIDRVSRAGGKFLDDRSSHGLTLDEEVPGEVAPVANAKRPRFGQLFVARLLFAYIALARTIGHQRATAAVGSLAVRLGSLQRRNKLAAKNIAAAFPDLSDFERRRILNGAWNNLARSVIEFFFIKEIIDDFSSGVRGQDALAERFRPLIESRPPGLIFTAHLTNVDLLAAMAARVGVPLTILYREPTNPIVDARMRQLRKALGGEWISSNQGAARRLARALHRRRHVTIAVDQRMPGSPILPFLGRPAHCNDIVARLARAFDCPVHSVRAIRQADGFIDVEVSKPLDLPRDAAGAIDVAAANKMIHGIIEGWVREHPDQYLWQHNRWRLDPPAD